LGCAKTRSVTELQRKECKIGNGNLFTPIQKTKNKVQNHLHFVHLSPFVPVDSPKKKEETATKGSVAV
jgi:hypothetical protein